MAGIMCGVLGPTMSEVTVDAEIEGLVMVEVAGIFLL